MAARRSAAMRRQLAAFKLFLQERGGVASLLVLDSIQRVEQWWEHTAGIDVPWAP